MASISKRPDGKWRARYRDDTGKEHAKHFGRKVDAQRWLDEVTASIVTGRYVDPKAGSLTFAAWYQTWMERQIWADSTRASAEMMLRSITFQELPLNKVKRSHVQMWIKSMHAGEKVLAARTIRSRFNFVRMAFQAAMKDKMIAEDPTDAVTLPRVRRAEADMMIPTPEQVGEAMGEAGDQFRAYVAVCAFAGLRLGEASGLQLGDIDFLRKTITVSRQVQGQNIPSTTVTLPKNGSERVVHVPEALINILAFHVREVGVWGAEQWLFGTGKHLWHRMLAGDKWRRLRKGVGMDEFTLHDLRHFYASGLIAAGCDVATVQRSLGHALPSITLNTYTHLWPRSEDKTRAAASGMMATALGSSADYLRTIALG